MAEQVCLKCGSKSIIPKAELADRTGHGPVWHRLEVSVRRTPDGLLPNKVKSEVRADVCGHCGFMELHAVDFASLWAAHQEATSRLLNLGRRDGV